MKYCTVIIRHINRVRSLELLGKHLSMFTDREEISIAEVKGLFFRFSICNGERSGDCTMPVLRVNRPL